MMPRHIAIYKRYDTDIGLQQGKDYQITTKHLSDSSITVTVITEANILTNPLLYPTEWELLQDWQILRTWKGK